VSQNHGSPRAEEVEVAIAISVEEVRALGARDKGRIAAHSAECSHRRVDASGEKSFGAKLQLTRSGEGAGHVFSIGDWGGPNSGENKRIAPLGGAPANCRGTTISSGDRKYCGFSLSQIEQGGNSLYPSIAQRATSVEVLRVLISVDPTETCMRRFQPSGEVPERAAHAGTDVSSP
jgi:hypothetical protein